METDSTTDAATPEPCPLTDYDGMHRSGEGPLNGSVDTSDGTFDGEQFELVKQFVEHLITEDRSGGAESDPAPPDGKVDWGVIQAATQGSDSLEQKIGRAVLVADQMSRGVFRYENQDVGPARPATPRRFFSLGPLTKQTSYAMACSMALVLLIATVIVVVNFGGTSVAASKVPGHRVIGGNAQVLGSAPTADLIGQKAPVVLPAATTPPAPAPPSLAGSAPLRPHEVFGFAPYWTLSQSGGFNVNGITTIAYFSIDVNADGSLDESGPGWSGYESQALADLITRAHAAGDRVVLTVTSFDQDSLNQLTSSPTAPSTLAAALTGVIQAKNLDGVNLDFEGQGSGDQAGLTNLVSHVSAAIHAVNPHYQVTMDTYASSAGDSNGFYNIRALAPVVDGFFVMEYQMNLQANSSPTSPLTSTMFSDRTAIEQYVAAAPAAKVILGMPYFGIDWPTSDGTLTAHATGPATDISDGQVMASGHPIYWDTTTDTAWTSYEVGTQWHETFFENPASLYDAAQLANSSGLGGVGIWALGMDGNDPSMLTALLGFAPAIKEGPLGPSATSKSTPTSSTTSTTTTPPSSSTSTTTTATIPTTTSSSSTSTSTSTSKSTTTTTLGGDGSTYVYTGTWQGHSVNLTMVSLSIASIFTLGPIAGQLSAFTTTDPSVTCLSSKPQLNVRPIEETANEYLVVAVMPGDCATTDFTFTSS
jgi:hypothetical protein